MQAAAINADFMRPALVRFAEAEWTPSPMPDVERLMLDRIGGEVARATSLVRYAPGSRFASHDHELGEEFLVLEGIFSDESGDFGPGVYVRNPPGSAHAPRSGPGCTIFVKLRQFGRCDHARVVIDTAAPAGWETAAPGVERRPLHRFGGETVGMLRFAEGAALEVERTGGLEFLAVKGSAEAAGTRLGPRDWLRLPPGPAIALRAAAEGTLLYVKSGHLAAAENAVKSDSKGL